MIRQRTLKNVIRVQAYTCSTDHIFSEYVVESWL